MSAGVQHSREGHDDLPTFLSVSVLEAFLLMNILGQLFASVCSPRIRVVGGSGDGAIEQAHITRPFYYGNNCRNPKPDLNMFEQFVWKNVLMAHWWQYVHPRWNFLKLMSSLFYRLQWSHSKDLFPLPFLVA